MENMAGRRSSGGRPRLPPWSECELREFRARIQKLMEMVSYSPEELDYVLGYSPRGRMTRQILRGRQPSRPYAEKFGRLEAEPPPPKPEWLPQAPKVLTGEAIPAFMVETERRECLECLALQADRQEVSQLHFFPGHPRQVVHSRCQTAWRRRRRWFRRCEELECEYLAILEGGRVPVCGSDEGCHLRRKPWHDPACVEAADAKGSLGRAGSEPSSGSHEKPVCGGTNAVRTLLRGFAWRPSFFRKGRRYQPPEACL